MIPPSLWTAFRPPHSLRHMHTVSVGRSHFAVVLAVALLAGCQGSERTGGGGTVIIGTAQDPHTLFPPNADNIQARAVTELIFQRLADLGPTLSTIGDAGFVPRLAQRWEWSPDSLSVTFHLDPHSRWEDSVPVTARDVQFAFAVYADPVVGARQRGDLLEVLDSISVVDSLTCIAWFRQRSPEQFYTLVTGLTPLPAHLLGTVPHDSLSTHAFARAPIGNGPFHLVRWEQQIRLELAPSRTYAGPRPVLDRVIWTFAPDPTPLIKQFMAGESDVLEGLPVDAAKVAETQPELRVVRLATYGYNFLQFNLHEGASERPHPLFADRTMRRALTMALDRELLVRSVFDTLGRVGLGPFVRAQWSADTTIGQLAFDRTAAARILDSLGWRAGADGMRSRAGRPLVFHVLVPTSSRPRVALAVLIQEQLRQTGVQVVIDQADNNAMTERVKTHAFDAVMSGLGATPSPSGIRQTWTSAAAKDGGFNYGRYEDRAFDADVDRALTAPTQTLAKAHYRAAYQRIVDDAPAIWLYEPPTLLGANARVQLGTVRPDAWWTGLPTWTIAPGKRLLRDAVTRTPTTSP